MTTSVVFNPGLYSQTHNKHTNLIRTNKVNCFKTKQRNRDVYGSPVTVVLDKLPPLGQNTKRPTMGETDRGVHEPCGLQETFTGDYLSKETIVVVKFLSSRRNTTSLST